MFLKMLTLIVFIAAIAVVLLDYRQQRLEMMNQMMRLHGQIDQSRQGMWDLQARIADHLEPPLLMKAIDRAELKLESTTPTPLAASASDNSGATSKPAANDASTNAGPMRLSFRSAANP